jgi:enoyl reductase-like protein
VIREDFLSFDFGLPTWTHNDMNELCCITKKGRYQGFFSVRHLHSVLLAFYGNSHCKEVDPLILGGVIGTSIDVYPRTAGKRSIVSHP